MLPGGGKQKVAFDLNAVRSETPGVANVYHFNAAGAALMPQCVYEAVTKHLSLEHSIGGYEAAAQMKPQLEDLYQAIAELLGVPEDPSQISIQESATMAWIQAFYSIPFQEGDVVLTVEAEYSANYVALLQMQKRKNLSIEVIPSDEFGIADLVWLEQRLASAREGEKKAIRLVSLVHCPTNSGLINPAEGVGALVAQHNALTASKGDSAAGYTYYLLDACQTVGQKPVNVKEIQCDFLSATSRKYLRGPRGMGFLFARAKALPTLLEPIVIDHYGAPWVSREKYELRPDAKRFEKWESSIANRLGLRAAVRYAMSLDRVACWQRIHHLGESLRAGLSFLTLHGDADSCEEGGKCRKGGVPLVRVVDLGRIPAALSKGTKKNTRAVETKENTSSCGGIVTFVSVHPAVTPELIVYKLKEEKPRPFNLTVSPLSSSRLDMEKRRLRHGICRASLHYYNTQEEIDQLVKAVCRVIHRAFVDMKVDVSNDATFRRESKL